MSPHSSIRSHRLVAVTAVILLGALPIVRDALAQGTPKRQVLINRTRIPEDTLRLLEQGYGTPIPNGKYWYDNRCGAWGVEGGPTLGFTVAGLPLGGPLPADISGGGTGVFINGRELHPTDLAGLQRLVGPVVPGRYWLDAQGYAGAEGGPPIANLWALASQGQYKQGGGVGENYGGGAGAYGNLNTGIGIITDGQGGAAVFNH